MWLRLLHDEEGILTFEWIVLLTLLVIGTVGGVAAIRDATIHEAQGCVGAMVSLDQSYFVTPPLGVCVQPLSTTASDCTSSACYSSFRDAATWGFGRVDRSWCQAVNSTGALCPLP